MINRKKLLLCHCNGSLSGDKRAKVLAFGEKKKLEVFLIEDLCELAVKDPVKLQEIGLDAELLVFACYPRTIKSLFTTAGISYKKIDCFNLRKEGISKIEPYFNRLTEGASAKKNSLDRMNDWVPWFPVIDSTRCNQCKQCLNFCLFGVYEQTVDSGVRVAAPENCKTNCPACARICPNVAIIFPKYTGEPINGGEVIDEKFEKARVRVDMDRILGSDIYKSLADRQAKAGKIRLLREQEYEVQEEERAYGEREAWLKKDKR